MKACTKCGNTKPLSEFGIRGGSSGSNRKPRSYCKACAKIARAKYHAAHKDRAKESAARRYVINQEKLIAYSRKYRADNPDRLKEQNAKWRAANREKHLATVAKYASEHPEARRINEQNRRARKREAGGKLSKGLAEKLFKLQRGKCACGCKQPLGDDYHLDHRMPLALGGMNTDDNMQLLTATCNMQKHAKHPIDFMQSRGFLI